LKKQVKKIKFWKIIYGFYFSAGQSFIAMNFSGPAILFIKNHPE